MTATAPPTSGTYWNPRLTVPCTASDANSASVPAKVAYYLGCMTLITPLWYASTLIGALVGKAIPASLSLDFALPVCFIALLAPLLRSAPQIAAAVVSVICAILFAGVPWSLGLVIAALAGVIAGAQTELWQERRAGRAE